MDLKKVFVKDACPTSIGGQAIIEGIMMRSPERTAIGIRLPDGRIFMKTEPSPKGSKWGKIPLIRGVVNFVASLVQGTKVLMYSADKLEEFYPEGYEKDKFDVWVEEKLGKEKAWKILMVLSVILAIAMSVGLFMVLPTIAVGWLSYVTDSILLKNLVEGLARILIFMIYVVVIAKMPDIKTVFQYHGAEHKTIHCFEKGLELTPENAQSFYTVHPRCGTDSNRGAARRVVTRARDDNVRHPDDIAKGMSAYHRSPPPKRHFPSAPCRKPIGSAPRAGSLRCRWRTSQSSLKVALTHRMRSLCQRCSRPCRL